MGDDIDERPEATDGIRGRILDLENAADEALLAYLAIGMGPKGWTPRDHEAFTELDRFLARAPEMRTRIARLETSILVASASGLEAAAALAGLATLVPTEAQLEERYRDLEAVAREALDAYRAIGMGPRGWNGRDRAAFSKLSAVLDDPYPTPPAAPAVAMA